MEKIKLGDKVRDSITGYEGVAIFITTYLNGCRRVGIQGNKLDDHNLPVDAYVVDETTLVVVKPQVKKSIQQETGGPNERVAKLNL